MHRKVVRSDTYLYYLLRQTEIAVSTPVTQDPVSDQDIKYKQER